MVPATGIRLRQQSPGSSKTGWKRPWPWQTAQVLVKSQPRRYYGTVSLDPTRVGRDTVRITEEVVAHLVELTT